MVAAKTNDWRRFIGPDVGSVSLQQWVEVDLQQLASVGNLSVADIRQAWTHFFGCVPVSTLVSDVTRAEAIAVFKYFRHLSETQGAPAPGYILKIHSLLKASWRRAIAMGYTAANPFSEWPRGILPERAPVTDRSEMVVESHDITRLISREEIPFLRRALYAFAFGVGFRVGEGVEIRFSDLRMMQGRTGLTICRAYSQKRKRVGPTKTRSSAVIPLHGVLEEISAELWQGEWKKAMGRSPEQGDLMFPRRWLNQPQHQFQGTILNHWHEDLESIGLAPRPFHCTRHSFVAMARGAGCDGDAIDSLIHPKNRSDTKVGYGRWPWETLCAQVDKLPLVRVRTADQLKLWGAT